MAGLSVAANAFSVVGLADVVFRLGVDTVGLYSRYQNASKLIASLVDEIQGFVELLTQIRVHLDEYNQSSYVQEDAQTLPSQLSKTLSDCEKDLLNLRSFASNNKSVPDDGLAVQMMKRWRWALQNDHVSKCCQRIRCHNQRLQTILSFIGRENDVVLRRELKSARKDANAATQKVHRALNDIEKEMTSRHEENNVLIRSQRDIVSQLATRAEEQHLELLEQISSISLKPTKKDGFIFEGNNLGAVVLPLLLMSSDLFKAIQTFQKDGVFKVSLSEAEWILQNFDYLLARGHEAAAQELDMPYTTPHVETNPEGMILHRTSDMNTKAVAAKHGGQAHFNPSAKDSALNVIRRAISCTATGMIVLEQGSLYPSFESEENPSASQVFRLTFYPNTKFSSTSVRMLISGEFKHGKQLQIPRLIQTFNIIPLDSDAWRSIEKNDVRGLEKVFTDRQGSPNDIFENGFSLCSAAADMQNTEICEFLLREGAYIAGSHPRGSYDLSCGFLLDVWGGILEKFLADPLAVMQITRTALSISALAIKHGCDANMLRVGHPLNMMCLFIHYYQVYRDTIIDTGHIHANHNSAKISMNELREIFSSMVGMGCELEGHDEKGQTALILACEYLQLDTINALIDIGANIHSTSYRGMGALHNMLLAKQHKDESEVSFAQRLYDGLVILLSKGCDPNSQAARGVGPTELAVSASRSSSASLKSWLKAIACIGYEVGRTYFTYPCGHGEDLFLVVFATRLSNEDKLPVSNITWTEWARKHHGLSLMCNNLY